MKNQRFFIFYLSSIASFACDMHGDYYDNPAERTNGEFDIVTEDELGYAFYEVKFKKKPVSDEMINEEIEQVKATGLNCYKYVFFSRSGFNCEKRENVVLIVLDEMFAK